MFESRSQASNNQKIVTKFTETRISLFFSCACFQITMYITHRQCDAMRMRCNPVSLKQQRLRSGGLAASSRLGRLAAGSLLRRETARLPSYQIAYLPLPRSPRISASVQRLFASLSTLRNQTTASRPVSTGATKGNAGCSYPVSSRPAGIFHQAPRYAIPTGPLLAVGRSG